MRILLAFILSLIGFAPVFASAEKDTPPWPSDGWYCDIHKKTFYSFQDFQQHIQRRHMKKGFDPYYMQRKGYTMPAWRDPACRWWCTRHRQNFMKWEDWQAHNKFYHRKPRDDYDY